MISPEMNTAPADTEAMPTDLVIGFRVDNRAHTLKKWPGALYPELTLGGYLAAVREPKRSPVASDGTAEAHDAAKAAQPALIASHYRGHDARSHSAQQAKGKALALSFDNDGGADLTEAIGKLLGCAAIVHNTYSDGQPGKGKRQRAIIPFDPASRLPSMLGAGYINQAIAEYLNSVGCKMDPTAQRSGQISYYGTLGPWSDGPGLALLNGPLLHLERFPELVSRAQDLFNEHQTKAGKDSADRFGSAIWNFNRMHDTETLMERYGWRCDATGKWKHPGQSATSGHSTVVYPDDKWNGFGETLLAAPVGTAAKNGTRQGDALDLIVWHELIERRKMEPAEAVKLGQYMARASVYGFKPDLDGEIDPAGYLAQFVTAALPDLKNLRCGGVPVFPKQIDLINSGALFEFSFATGYEEIAVLEHYIDPWLPKGIVVGMYGRGEVGKSSWVATQCAQASKEVSTLWVTSEEPQPYVLKRHVKAGGDPNTLAVMPAYPKLVGIDQVAVFDVKTHLEKVIVDVSKACNEDRPLGIVVLDAIATLVTWGQGESPNDDGSVKKMIAGLQTLAERYGLTIVIIGHFNKRAQNERYIEDAVTGSAAWTNSVRRAFAFTRNEDPTVPDYQFFVQTVKANTGTRFAAGYETYPVHTIHSRAASGGADEGLFATRITTEIAWGPKAINDLINDGDVDDDMRKRSGKAKDKLQSRTDAVEQIIKDLGNIARRTDIIDYAKSSSAYSELKLAPHHFSRGIDISLQARGVTIIPEGHNTFRYKI